MPTKKPPPRQKPAGSGRPPAGPDGEARTHSSLVIRMSESESEDLDRRAERAGLTKADYARGLLWPGAS